MVKLHSPILSLDARGSLANAITLQKRFDAIICRTKPTPTDRKTLQQMYQRWRYQHYLAAWKALTPTQQLYWQSLGARYHNTPVGQFLSYHLKKLPDLVAEYRLDTISGAVAYDSSKNAFHGTIIGASPTTGIIDGALLFDGLNDRVEMGVEDGIVHGDISLESFITFTPGTIGQRELISKKHDWSGAKFNYDLSWYPYPDMSAARIHFQYGDSAARYTLTSGLHSWNAGTPYHICVTHDGQNVRFYINGDLVHTVASAHTLAGKNDYALKLGCLTFGNTRVWRGILDHAAIYSGVLTPTQVKLHSSHRYP